MDYIKVSKAAEKWGLSTRRVRVLCAEGKIPGVIRKGAAARLSPSRTRLGGNSFVLFFLNALTLYIIVQFFQKHKY